MNDAARLDRSRRRCVGSMLAAPLASAGCAALPTRGVEAAPAFDLRRWFELVDVDDWMHLVDGRHLLNRATFSRWGIHIGEFQIAFQAPERAP